MSRLALSIAVVVGLLSSPAWALPHSLTCRASDRARLLMPRALACSLVQDPWQDCDEDPWQLSSTPHLVDDRFSDPWQDDADPWQPVFSESPAGAGTGEDPWQPLVSQLAPAPAASAAPDAFEDPWQPAFADPWQEGADDPWQLP